MSNQSTKNSGMNDDGMLNAETQRKLPQGKISQPKLRFKGFTDPWQQRKLGEVTSSLSAGRSVNALDAYPGEEEVGVLKTSSVSDDSFNPHESKTVVKDERGLVQCPVEAGTIIVSRMNTPERVGSCGLVVKAQSNLYLPDRLWKLKLKSGNDSRFLHVLLTSNIYKSRIVRMATGTSGSMHNIPKDSFLDMRIVLPDIAEQTRIGEFFRALDDLIAAAKKKADLLKLKKRYYLQAIFSQQLRFKGFTGPWQQRKLGDLLKFERPDRYIEPDGDYLSKGATPVLTANKGFVLGYTNNPEGIYDKGPCVIFDDFTLDRKLVRCPFKVRSSAIKILTANPSVDLYFMFELLEFQKFPSLGHARHYISVVEPWRTPVPDYLEQTHIGEMFRVMDDLIVAVTRRIELLERQKTAYLQCLFV